MKFVQCMASSATVRWVDLETAVEGDSVEDCARARTRVRDSVELLPWLRKSLGQGYVCPWGYSRALTTDRH